MERLTDRIAEDEVVTGERGGACGNPFLALALALLPENSDRLRVEVDESPASRGLGWTDDDGVADRRERLHDGELGGVEIDVGPSKADDLPTAHAGRGKQDEGGEQSM